MTSEFVALCWYSEVYVSNQFKFLCMHLFQFESYQVEKTSKNVNEAAKHLEEM